VDEYTHDPIDQLVRVRYQVSGGVPVRDVQYQYDRVGNRQVVTDNGVPVTYTVNNMNQYTTVGGEPLSYDANGNLTSMPGLTLQYDSWNRLISAATESNLVLFAYDGRNRCVKRVEIQNGIGRTTFMVWGHEPSQGWGLLEKRGANGELLARHVHGPSVDDLVLSELGGAVYYYHHDHLNSTIAVTDESGNVVEQYRYDAYGQPYFYGPDGTPRSESAIGIRFLFTGREWLASLGLYDYRHRAYSPSLGRFLQMDPLGFGARDVNVYRYCGNNPEIFVDAYGEAWSWGAVALGAGLGAVGGFAAGVGQQLVRAIQGGRFEWKEVARVTVASAAGGAVYGAFVGALTGDPSALLVGTTVLYPTGAAVATVAAYGGMGFVTGVVLEALSSAQDSSCPEVRAAIP
jgi:RHS repeat-associated protein